MRWKKYCSTDCTIELAECPLTGNLSLLLSTRTERPNTTEHNVPIFLDVKGPISLHFQNRTSQYLSHSEWNRTSQCYWTQCPNTSWCQGSYFSPFSELNVPIFRSFWVEHNVPILRLVMGLIYLSDLWTHINLKSVWSSLNLVWHMSCHISIVPVNIHQFEPCRDIRSYISDVYNMGSNWTYSISWWDINYIYWLYCMCLWALYDLHSSGIWLFFLQTLGLSKLAELQLHYLFIAIFK